MKKIEELQFLAESGDGPANLELGVAYWGDCLYGPLKKTPKDFALAVKYFVAAAERGEDRAYDYLARAYKSGKGVERNPKIAKEWRARYENLDRVRDYERDRSWKGAKGMAVTAVAAIIALCNVSHAQHPRIWWTCLGLALVAGPSAIVNAGQVYWGEANTAKQDALRGHDPSTTNPEGDRYYRSHAAMRRLRGFSFVASAAVVLCVCLYLGESTATNALLIAALLAGAYGGYTWFDAAEKLRIIERDEWYRKRESKLYSIRTAADKSLPEQQPITSTEYDTI